MTSPAGIAMSGGKRLGASSAVVVMAALVAALWAVSPVGAADPVTADPQIGDNDFRISDMGPDGDPDYDAFGPVAAYNPAANEYLVVWEGEDLGGALVEGEFEIFGQRIDAATGAPVGDNDFRISDMGPDGDRTYDAQVPAVTYNPAANEYLVVWEGDDNRDGLVEGESEIFGQRLSATGAPVGENDFRISDVGPDGDATYNGYEPAVAYNTAANEYLVVWYGDGDGALVDGENEIFGQRLSATGSHVGDNDFRISNMGPDGDDEYDAFVPALAYNPTANEYLVVWYGDDNQVPLVEDEHEIFGQRLSAAGAPVGDDDFRISNMGPNGDTEYGGFSPQVVFNPTANQYLVVWYGDDNRAPLVEGENEIFGQRLSATGSHVGDNDFRISDMGPNGDVDYDTYDPALSYSPTANQYLVVWESDDTQGGMVDGEFEIFAQRLSAVGAHVGDDDFRISDMGPDGDASWDAASAAVAHNTASNEDFVVWRGDDDPGPLVEGEFEVFGQRLNALTGAAVTVGLVDPATGVWRLRDPAGVVTSFYFGDPGDVPVIGDWNCDGTDTPGLFRLSDAFAYLRNSNDQGNADIRFFFGNPSDIPLAGDWNGDGCDTLSIYRPSEQRFYIVNALGANEGGLGPADYFFDFGNPGDKPVVGDWDGDGIDEVGLHRESSGFFYYRDTLDTGIATAEFFFGDPGDRFVAGDWNATGHDKPAVFRPSSTTFYFRHTLTQGNADAQFTWGESGWLPVAGHFG